MPEALPDRLHRLEVPPRLDLELDAAVALPEVPLHLVEELADRARDAHGDSGRHPLGDATEVAGQGDADRAQLRVEHGHLQRGLRHLVALESRKQRLDVLSMEVVLREQRRYEVALESQPCRLDVLGGVHRIGSCDALSPPLALGGLDADEHRLADRLGPERGTEGANERHGDAAQLDRVQFHGRMVPPRASWRDASPSGYSPSLCAVSSSSSSRSRARGRASTALALLVVAGAVAGCRSAAFESSSTTSTTVTTRLAATTTSVALSTTTTTTTQARRATRSRLDDGSLGDQATRLACRLLSRAQIKSQFGGPVSIATPTYPYCQWLVGSDAFLALAVEPHTSFATATQYVDTLQTIDGLGQEAIIANNRYLYFTDSSTSYWLLWQQVGDFSELHSSQLVALARDVLAQDRRASEWPAPVPVPAGPPIYFAGDSTAAGPEWAWDTYHVTSSRLRTLAEYQVGSGLVASDYFNWPRHILAIVAARRPKLVIYMGSANDGQELLVDGAYQPVGSPLWREAYAARVAAIMTSVVQEGASNRKRRISPH